MLVNQMRTCAGAVNGFISGRLMAAYRLDDDHTIHVAVHTVTSDHRLVWHYVLEHDGTVIFEGTDITTPPNATYGEAARTALVFLTLRPGDVDEDFFAGYTPEQLAWRDTYAEDLAVYGMEPEEYDR